MEMVGVLMIGGGVVLLLHMIGKLATGQGGVIGLRDVVLEAVTANREAGIPNRGIHYRSPEGEELRMDYAVTDVAPPRKYSVDEELADLADEHRRGHE